MVDLRGRMLALEGVDGVGKSTATAALAQLLSARGLDVAQHDFPVYDEPRFGPVIDAFLKGEVRIEGARTPEVVATLFAANRAATAPALRNERDLGRTLLCDRYHLSNAAYQGARIPDPGTLDDFLDWILGVELDVMGALKPDVSLWLRVPLDMRPHRARAHDVYERDQALQQRVHDTYEHLAARGDVIAVDGVSDGRLLAPDDIAQALAHAADVALAAG